MILNFSLKNFYSFRDSTTINFKVNKKAPDNNDYIKTKSKLRVSKVGIVIGPNASGKTNLLKAIPFLRWILIESYNDDPSYPVPITPFLFGKVNKFTELSVDFEVNSNIYKYTVIIDSRKIFYEELSKRSLTVKKETFKKLFYRKWNNKTSKYLIKDNGFKFPQGALTTDLRKNSSLIASAVRSNHELSSQISNEWKKVGANIVEGGMIENNPEKRFQKSLEYFFYNEEKKREAEKLLSKYDFGLEKFIIQEEKGENNKPQISAYFTHLYHNNEYSLPIQYESSGTRRIIVLLKTILNILAVGGIAVLDEIDTNIHPDIVEALIELFLNPNTNPNDAQLFFSLHNFQILNRFDKYQIFFTEKTHEGVSSSWRLDEMKGVKANDNYLSKYTAGVYGATPKIE
jgi:hypothetical protein